VSSSGNFARNPAAVFGSEYVKPETMHQSPLNYTDSNYFLEQLAVQQPSYFLVIYRFDIVLKVCSSPI
jgi:hypothetical protein